MSNKISYLTIASIPILLALTSVGCATRGYARRQVAPVDTKVAALDAKTTQMAEKQQSDVSRLEEMITSTDAKVGQAATAAEQANASAAKANSLAAQNQAALAANQASIAAADSSIANLDKSMAFSLVSKGDVTFGFDKTNLGATDQAALDALIQQTRSMPRAQFELIGFTDKAGSNSYNLALSRRRSEAVARYLLRHGVRLQSIHMIGLGEEPVPPELLADAKAIDGKATDANSRRLARRVLIRIYAPDTTTQSASLQQ